MQQIILTLLFLLGTVFGSISLISWTQARKFRAEVNKAASAALAGLLLVYVILTIDSDFSHHEILLASIFSAAVSFAIAFAYFLRDVVLPVINELILLALTVSGAAILYFNNVPTILLLLYSIPLLFVSVIAVLPVALSRSWRVTLYCWYLALLISLVLFISDLSIFQPLIGNPTDLQLGTMGLYALLSGSLFSYVMVNLTYLVAFIVPKQSSESTKAYLTRRSEYAKSIMNKFSPIQHHPLTSILIIVLIPLLYYTANFLGYPLSFVTVLIFTAITFIGQVMQKFKGFPDNSATYISEKEINRKF